MPTPPCKSLINMDELFGSRDLRLQELRDSEYPRLTRLCADFDFSVLQLQRKTFSHLSRKMVPCELEFVLAIRDEASRYWYSVTPCLASLKMLDEYAKRHEVDLLHMHLFGDADDEFNQLQDNRFY
ncbi:MAG TPA: hypothetical protein VLC79_02140 [Cellvibrio sp.]|nr:hypothetical protein [Cellvibrio sp.]